MHFTDKKFTQIKRQYFPAGLRFDQKDTVIQVLNGLLEQTIESPDDLKQYLRKYCEFYRIYVENYAWKYIRKTTQADNPDHQQEFNRFYNQVVSEVDKYEDKLNRKFYESSYRNQLDHKYFAQMNRIISNQIELFREDNIPLSVEDNEVHSQYDVKMSQIKVPFRGEELTIQQTGKFFLESDRETRKQAWLARSDALENEKKFFHELMDKLIRIRNRKAHNAGFSNFRDYQHLALNRFDYTPEDIYEFHESVEKEVMPFIDERYRMRKQKLGIEKLRPYDLQVNIFGEKLVPFQNVSELIDNGIRALGNVNPEFGKHLEMMRNSGFLDLDNRPGKAPGGYNFPLEEHGTSFIFMNAIGVQRDIETLFHEAGHALHHANMKNIPYHIYLHPSSEIAELASMSIELLSNDQWVLYYPDSSQFKQARVTHLESAIMLLPMVMQIDGFQHWLYLNPDHSHKEREDKYLEIFSRYHQHTCLNWEGLERHIKNRWMIPGHPFSNPFYYIEYAISQLGALAIYRNYKLDPDKALNDFERFTGLGYSRSLKEIYQAAGIEFSFSGDYIRSLVEFVRLELEELV